MVTVGLILTAASAHAAHFRGASLTWKRLASPANTIEATVTESWRTGQLGANTYNWGDNQTFTTSGAPTIVSNTSFTTIRRVANHSYTSEGPWTISTSGCCRISNLTNAANQNWFLSSVVDMRGGNQGSPVITSPVVLQMVRGGINTLPLAFVDVDGDPVTFRMATFAESGIPTVPTAGGQTLAVSPAGVLSWDTSSTTVGQLYAAQVIASDNHPFPGGIGMTRVQFDFVIQIVDGTLNRPPVVTGDSGPFIATIGQPFSNVIVGTDPDGGPLTVTHQGLPPGATLTPPSGTTGNQPLSATFNWTPTLAQADSSFGITLIFTDPGGLQTSKSFAITVPSNQAPVVNAGPDQTVYDKDTGGNATSVSLNGSGSYDPESVPLTYAWTQTGGAPVTLNNPNSPTPSFTAPTLHVHPNGEPDPVNLQFRLTVSDGRSNRIDDVVITVKHRNLVPVAVAFGPATAPEALLVTLDGSASTDPDFDPLHFTWSQLSGTAVTLAPNGTNNPFIGFTHVINAPHSVPGELLEFVLQVSDGIDSATSTVVPVFVQNINQPPVADAGHVHPVFDDAGEVHLDGFGYDPDGDSVSFLWTQVAGPAVTLDDPTSAEPHFIAPFVSPALGSVTLTFQLAVSDAIDGNDVAALTTLSSVDILVKHANRAPIAAAGPDQTVPELSLVTLDGSGSFDPDNDPLASYQWVQTSGSAVVLNTSDPVRPSFTSPDVTVAGEILTFDLVVSDGSLPSRVSTTSVTVNYVNRVPVLDAIPDQTHNEGTVVVLQATANDPDGNQLTLLWSQQSGSPVLLDLTDPASPTFTAPAVSCEGGVVSFKVVVSDGYPGGETSGIAVVNVTNVNNPPVADAGPSQSIPENTVVGLEGSFSSDPDFESLDYSWVQTGGPTVVLSNSQVAQPAFTAPIVTAGGDPNASVTLQFDLTVTDDCGGQDTDSVEITVANIAHIPLADAGGSQSVNETAAVTLDASASSDPDGDALSYAWSQISGPTVALGTPNSPQASFTAPFVGSTGDTLVFEVVVSDGFGGVARDTVTIAVLNINTPPSAVSSRASIGSLWPPNHAMVPISILGVQDPENNSTITITSVTQDEPTNGLGDGDTAIDAIIQGSTVLIRSERWGRGDGRVYHIHFTTSDLEGSDSGVVTVSVPKSKKGDLAIDGGELFNSTN